jgi:hypothetical protein
MWRWSYPAQRRLDCRPDRRSNVALLSMREAHALARRHPISMK